MKKLSGVIITFNEEEDIQRCIDSLKNLVDEILIVDSFSTDRTQEICELNNVKFMQNKFEGHIQQKNFAMKSAKFDWILSLDADEELSFELKQSILTWKKSEDTTAKGYWINRLNNYCGYWMKRGGWYPDKKIRLWHREFGMWKGENPHDFVVMNKGVIEGKLKGDIKHYTYKVIQDHINQSRNFAIIGANAAYGRGKSTNIVMIYLKPCVKFIGSYFVQFGFLDGKLGLIAAKYVSLAKYIKYKELYRLQKKNKPG